MEKVSTRMYVVNYEEYTQKIEALEKEINEISCKKDEMEEEVTHLLVLVMKTEDWKERCKLGTKSDVMLKECGEMRENLEKLKFELEVTKYMQNNIKSKLFNAESTRMNYSAQM